MFSKKIPEPVPEEETSIWSCESEACKGWMRNNFAFQEQPDCPLCGSGMQQESRVLPIVANPARNYAFH